MVFLAGFGGGVAPAVVGHRAVAPEQVGAVGERFERREILRLSRVPQVLGCPRYPRLHLLQVLSLVLCYLVRPTPVLPGYPHPAPTPSARSRSEERRVGKE